MHDEIRSYFDSVPAARRERLRQIHDLIVTAFPQVMQTMSWRMPAYKLDTGWVAIANQKHHISVYTCSSELIASYLQKHRDIGAGKGCLRFRDNQEIDLAELKKVVRNALHSKTN